MFHYVYKITLDYKGLEYIGLRSCDCEPKNDDYMGSGVLLKRLQKKLGLDLFSKTILNIFDLREDAANFEKRLVTKEYIDLEHTLNLITGGENESRLGSKHSEKTLQDLSLKLTGKIRDQEFKDNVSKFHKGKVTSKETKIKMSQSAKGRIISDEQRAKISKTLKGRIISDEHRANIGKSIKGRKISEQTRKNMSIAAKKRGNNRKGTTHKPETIEKFRQAALKREAKKRNDRGQKDDF